MLTLFSAPGYKGASNNDINMGASVEISSTMNISIKQIQVTEKFRQKRIMDVEQRKTTKSKQPPQQPQNNSKSIESLSTSSLFR
ncbi:unnamed protein product [Gongylonema pulchrum]|uniref:Uncharacterized protein n=1 Tax=Gongylonema pulchrum TaxID=637853 RepID=A0A183EVL3_9BILA|nr:unnamed protein product [Gongylonema pulchrum]VDN43626.1 unnamed protein product [Gongylonema pulchrum]